MLSKSSQSLCEKLANLLFNGSISLGTEEAGKKPSIE